MVSHRMRKFRKARICRFGAATVEMALVTPFILLFVFSSFEFARLMMVRQGMTNAVREGCRSATLKTTRDLERPEKIVRETLLGVVRNAKQNEDLRITFSPSPASAQSGDDIVGSVEIDCEDMSWMPPIFTSGLKIRCTCTMKRE